MADTNTPNHLDLHEETEEEKDDVLNINLGDSVNSETKDSIEHCLEDLIRGNID